MDGRTIAVDYETVELTAAGPVASTEAYRDNFRVSSCAFTYREDGRLVSWFVEGEDEVRAELEKLGNAPLIAHNLPFELLVSRCRFPDLKLNWVADTMRLAQVYDNGGRDSDFDYVLLPENILVPDDKPKLKRVPTSGLGLVKCAHRILGDSTNHKAEAHNWIYANVPKSKGKAGKLLHLLPRDILVRYNIADTEITLRLYEYCLREFKRLEFDWTFDHRLYLSSVEHIVNAQIRGVPVDRPALQAFELDLKAEMAKIGQDFRDRFAAPIEQVEHDRLTAWLSKVKTQKGKDKRRAKWEARDPKAVKEVGFNVGSNNQLAALFVGKMEMAARFFTDKGAPSFKSAMLSQWGEAGAMLKTRRKRQIVLKQVQSLLALTEYDGRWHVSLRAAGTATGRYSGGSHA